MDLETLHSVAYTVMMILSQSYPTMLMKLLSTFSIFVILTRMIIFVVTLSIFTDFLYLNVRFIGRATLSGLVNGMFSSEYYRDRFIGML